MHDMYGTVYRFQVKPGKEQELPRYLHEEQTEIQRLLAAGMIARYIYKLDNGGYAGAVLWESKERYHVNANHPAQKRWDRGFRELLEADPEWNDGEIVASVR
jgi:hypothetical protein